MGSFFTDSHVRYFVDNVVVVLGGQWLRPRPAAGILVESVSATTSG